mgnify:CR=1 FL=1
MTTTKVSIGSRTTTVDTETPASSSGSGPLYVVAFGTTPSGIAVGDMGFMDTQDAGGGSPSDYEFVVTVISGANITLKYLRDTGSKGDHSPLGLYTGAGSSGSPTQAAMVFKRHGLPTSSADGAAPSYVVTFSDAGPPADSDVGDIAFVAGASANFEYLITAIDLSAKTATMKYLTGSGQTSPYGIAGSNGTQAVLQFKRAFSTITLFEAMVDDASPTYWGSSDDVVGECHADSTFTDNDINFNSKQSLASVTLTVVSGDRHDGTAESGVLIKPTTRGTHSHGLIQVQIDNMTIEWLDISLASIPNASGGSTSQQWGIAMNGNNIDDLIIRNNLIHDCEGDKGSSGPLGIVAYTDGGAGNTWSILNNIIYNFTEGSNDSAGGIVCRKFRGTFNIYNNTVYKITGQGGNKDANGIKCGYYTNTVPNIKNNIVAGLTASDQKHAFNIESNVTSKSVGTNLSDDTADAAETAQTMGRAYDSTVNPGALVGQTLVEIDFVNTVAGSEDLHLDTDSVCREAGVDLGTTNGVNIDIDQVDRDAAGVTWDIGADQATLGAGSAGTAFIMFLDT